MDALRLDGNAAAGTLGEVFSFEVTTAEYTCEGCGKTDRIGAAMVYEVRGLGTIVRCPQLRPRPDPARPQPWAAPARSEGHQAPAGRGRRRVTRAGSPSCPVP